MTDDAIPRIKGPTGFYFPFKTPFWNRIDRSAGPDGCWPWLATRTQDGYGRVWSVRLRRKIGAHRQAYELANGHLPDDLDILHHCDNPPCCNPAHLFEGTNDDNIRDMISKGRNSPPPLNNRRGEDAWNCKITDAEVESIRQIYNSGGISQREIGSMFGIDASHVSDIVRGKKRQNDGAIIQTGKGRIFLRITEEKIEQIRATYGAGGYTFSAIGRMFGISGRYASDIISGKVRVQN